MKFPQLRQFCVLTLSHILGTHSVFSQFLPVSCFDIFSVENNPSIIFTTTTTNVHALQVHVPNSAINRIFKINIAVVLSVLDSKTNTGYVENNKRSFNVLILPNGL
jgi:hypothetical protein